MFSTLTTKISCYTYRVKRHIKMAGISQDEPNFRACILFRAGEIESISHPGSQTHTGITDSLYSILHSTTALMRSLCPFHTPFSSQSMNLILDCKFPETGFRRNNTARLCNLVKGSEEVLTRLWRYIVMTSQQIHLTTLSRHKVINLKTIRLIRTLPQIFIWDLLTQRTHHSYRSSNLYSLRSGNVAGK